MLKEAVTHFMGHCRNVPPHSPGELRCIIYSCIKVWMCVRGDGETRASCPSFLSVHSGADVVVQKGSISSALSFLSNVSFFFPCYCLSNVNGFWISLSRFYSVFYYGVVHGYECLPTGRDDSICWFSLARVTVVGLVGGLTT